MGKGVVGVGDGRGSWEGFGGSGRWGGCGGSGRKGGGAGRGVVEVGAGEGAIGVGGLHLPYNNIPRSAVADPTDAVMLVHVYFSQMFRLDDCIAKCRSSLPIA